MDDLFELREMEEDEFDDALVEDSEDSALEFVF